MSFVPGNKEIRSSFHSAVKDPVIVIIGSHEPNTLLWLNKISEAIYGTHALPNLRFG